MADVSIFDLTSDATPAATNEVESQITSDGASRKSTIQQLVDVGVAATAVTAPSLTAGTVTTNANLTGHITSTGNATVLGSFTSAQLATALTNETGTGSAVFATSPTLVTPVLGTPTSGDLSNCDGYTESMVIAVSDETTALTTGTAKLTFRMPYAFTLTAVRASVTTAPTGSVLTVDINETGTTILSTKLTIDATELTSQTAATPAVISDSALADDAQITIDIDTVGSTIAGAGLKVYLIGNR